MKSSGYAPPLASVLSEAKHAWRKHMSPVTPVTALKPTNRPRTTQPPVLCLHCSSGSARQWRSLESHLSGERRIIAPDLLGYGSNPPWRSARRLHLSDEVHALRSTLASVEGPVDVVAHSFGAVVAMKLALDHPGAVRSLCLYEPVVFGLLREQAASTRALVEIFMVAGGVESALAVDDSECAARRFIDFWSGRGSWKSMSKSHRAVTTERVAKVLADFEAVLSSETSHAGLRRLKMPVLCLSGGRSPAATQRICEVLAEALPLACHVRLPDAGHMGPLTHPREVNTRVAAFLAGVGDDAAKAALALPSNPFAARAA